jgi:hypothetical protein
LPLLYLENGGENNAKLMLGKKLYYRWRLVLAVSRLDVFVACPVVETAAQVFAQVWH